MHVNISENKYFVQWGSRPDGGVFIIQGNSLNCHQLKSHKKLAVLLLEFYKVQSQEFYTSCAHAIQTVPDIKMEKVKE